MHTLGDEVAVRVEERHRRQEEARERQQKAIDEKKANKEKRDSGIAADCRQCRRTLLKSLFSKKQWSRRPTAVCSGCTDKCGTATHQGSKKKKEKKTLTKQKHCHQCRRTLPRLHFTKNQLSKGKARKCSDCTGPLKAMMRAILCRIEQRREHAGNQRCSPKHWASRRTPSAFPTPARNENAATAARGGIRSQREKVHLWRVPTMPVGSVGTGKTATIHTTVVPRGVARRPVTSSSVDQLSVLRATLAPSPTSS